MTKEHFIAFAREIADSDRPREEKAAMAWLIIRVAREFNPRFDAVRFMRATGLSVDDAERYNQSELTFNEQKEVR